MNVEALSMDCLMPKDYAGRCLVTLCAGLELELVLPTLDDAVSVARYALNPEVGGFSFARIESTDKPVTYKSPFDWLFEN